MSSANVLTEEVEKFDRLATRWWDPSGPMRPLHQMNPARVGWILSRLPAPTRILDVGCGAGLAAEAMARAGHEVLGIDASEEAIAAAQEHANGQGLPLDYRQNLAEDLVAEGRRFPVITALEVIEHVPNAAGFIALLAELLEPGGILVISTLNRTRRSLLTAKVGAEYVLRLLPAGTHDWRAFLTPAETARLMRNAGLRLHGSTGLVPAPLSGGWRTTRSMAVNYMIAGIR
jgi:2-polyprenyl-6-hydroxyphenyl methylase / 3-demethylubiquinone-9 3-methyltransferase